MQKRETPDSRSPEVGISVPRFSLRTTDVFPVVASLPLASGTQASLGELVFHPSLKTPAWEATLPPKEAGREATTANTSAVRMLSQGLHSF